GPPWPLDGRCGLGRRGRRRRPTPIKRRRLLDRAPILLVVRDHRRHDILGAVVPTALRDADLGHEDHTLKLPQAYGATRARFRALVVGIETERAVEDRLELAASDLSGLPMALGGALQTPPLGPFLALVRPVSDGKHNGKHLAVTLLAVREHPILADAARLDVYDDGGRSPLRNLRFELRWRGIGIIESHLCLLYV